MLREPLSNGTVCLTRRLFMARSFPEHGATIRPPENFGALGIGPLVNIDHRRDIQSAIALVADNKLWQQQIRSMRC
jgi:hypothetical protein